VSLAERQSVILAVLGALFSVSVLILGHRGKLSFRFVLGWLLFGLTFFVTGALIFAVVPLSEALGITPATLGFVVSVIVPVAIAVELSMTVSRQQQQIRKLAEEVALIGSRLLEAENNED
jgi:hypothetical protein